MGHIICNSVEFIEENRELLKYSDLTLYDHQKSIFNACKANQPKLILYIAPTGTGKTLTPLGLSQKNRVIFVCAARHVGLALARSAVSIHKKIAFAFGCNSADDVRLHYFAAKEYTINKRSGGIRKVDNSIGDKVEIMICDIKSYLFAMYYMLAFNTASNIITYWDEPTITLDYSTFIHFCEEKNWILSSAKINRNFGSLDEIDMKSIKIHYLKTLKNILPGTWGSVFMTLKIRKEKRILPNDKIDIKGNRIQKSASIGPGVVNKTSAEQLTGAPLVRLSSEQQSIPSIIEDNIAGIYVTTKDAFTLTDGPSIFLASDVKKIAKFCIQQANIPALVMTTEPKDKKIIQLQDQIDMLRSMIKHASLNDIFIPNKLAHIQKWASDCPTKRAFTSNIDEETIMDIMRLKNVEDSWKVLLLMGIGVFATHEVSEYTEIMKKLADKQQLYLIIADSDYIYGTNYQFCHGYLSKDMKLSQEKIIQALGRIGRNNIQQEFSIRFRDDEQVNILFKSFLPEEKPEVINMNLLFTSKSMEWDGANKVYISK